MAAKPKTDRMFAIDKSLDYYKGKDVVNSVVFEMADQVLEYIQRDEVNESTRPRQVGFV